MDRSSTINKLVYKIHKLNLYTTFLKSEQYKKWEIYIMLYRHAFSRDLWMSSLKIFWYRLQDNLVARIEAYLEGNKINDNGFHNHSLNSAILKEQLPDDS